MKIQEGERAPDVEIGEAARARSQGSILDLQGSVEARERPEDFETVREVVKRKRTAVEL